MGSSRNTPSHSGGTLRDDPENGCAGDYFCQQSQTMPRMYVCHVCEALNASPYASVTMRFIESIAL